MAKKTIRVSSGLLFALLFALLVALYDLVFAKVTGVFTWGAFTEAFFISIVALLLTKFAGGVFKIKGEFWQYVFVTVIIGIIYGLSTGSGVIFFAIMFESILALAIAYGLMQTKVFKKLGI